MSVQSQATFMPKKEAIVHSFYIHCSIICLLTFVLRSGEGFSSFSYEFIWGRLCHSCGSEAL